MADDTTMADIPTEGEVTFPPTDEGVENENSTDSHSEENTTDDPVTDAGEDTKHQEDDNKDIPFHQHPAWQRREKEWKERYNEQETRHVQELGKIHEEISSISKSDKTDSSDVPNWFGGDEKAWGQFKEWQGQSIKAAEERAFQRVTEEKQAQEKAIADATKYMQDEIADIEGDKELNPEGKKIDQNKLLKIVMDNDLIDSKGQWNYRAGWRFIQSQVVKNQDAKQRKTIAAATTSGPKGEETKSPTFKTAEDFITDRPW